MVVSRVGSPIERFAPCGWSEGAAARFWERGYVELPGLLSEAEMDELEATVDRLVSSPLPQREGNRFDYSAPGGAIGDRPKVVQTLYAADYAPTLFESPALTRAADAARRLLGEPPIYGGSHVVDKPPMADNHTPWHQDEAFWEPELRHRAVSLWLPMTSVDADNGCMELEVGSHRGEVRPHRPLGGDARVHGLELDPDAVSGQTALVPLARGDATLHHCRAVHRTGPNRTARLRRALVVNFASPLEPDTSGRRFPWRPAPAAGPSRARRIFEG